MAGSFCYYSQYADPVTAQVSTDLSSDIRSFLMHLGANRQVLISWRRRTLTLFFDFKPMARVIMDNSSDQEQERQDHQAGFGAVCTSGDDFGPGDVRLQ